MASSETLPGIVLEGLTCNICFCAFKDPKVLDCGHTFCSLCLKSVVRKKKNQIKCPNCRSSTKVRSGNIDKLTSNTALMSLVQDVMHLEESCGGCHNICKRTSLSSCYQCGIPVCVNCKVSHSEHCEGKADHMKHQHSTTSLPLITQCQVHRGESNTKVCLSCDKELCKKCEGNHPKENHELKSKVTFINELRMKASGLKKESKLLVDECTENYKIVVQNEHEAKDLFGKLNQQINEEYVTSLENLDRRKKFLQEFVVVLRKETAKHEEDMAKCCMESKNLMMKINESSGQMSRSPLNKMSLQVAALNEIESKVIAVRNRQTNKTKLSSESVSLIQKVHFEKSPTESSIGFFTIHDWTRTDIPLRSGTMSCATLYLESKIAVGYFGGGVELISVNGSKHTVLKEVKVLAMACLNSGGIVLRDIDNGIEIYDVKLKKSQAKFSTLGKEEGGEGSMTVSTRDDIFVSFNRVKQIHVYSQQGGEAIRIINCGKLIPQQISATPNSGVLVIDASLVMLIDEHGNCKSEIKRKGWFGYPSVSSEGSLFVAWVHEEERNVRIMQCANQLHRSTLVLTDYSLPPIGRNWYQLQLLPSDEIALIAPDTMHLYRRQKTTIGDKSSAYTAQNIGSGLAKVLV